jgi:hypothetical protein
MTLRNSQTRFAEAITFSAPGSLTVLSKDQPASVLAAAMAPGERGIREALLDSMRTTAVEELTNYLRFGRGWDGYDAEIFEPRTVRRAIRLVDRIYARLVSSVATPMLITPGPAPDGRIDVEAATNRRRIIVTLDPAEESVAVFHEERTPDDQGMAQSNNNDVERWIDWLVGTTSVPYTERQASGRSARANALAIGPQEGPSVL